MVLDRIENIGAGKLNWEYSNIAERVERRVIGRLQIGLHRESLQLVQGLGPRYGSGTYGRAKRDGVMNLSRWQLDVLVLNECGRIRWLAEWV